jgi:hypothetical protein
MITLSFSTLILMVLALGAFAVWHDGVRAREAANRVAIDACRRRSLQFLDGTVVLAGLRPRLDRTGFRIERNFVFDYATDGVGRASGFIIMLGDEVQHVGLENRSES